MFVCGRLPQSAIPSIQRSGKPCLTSYYGVAFDRADNLPWQSIVVGPDITAGVSDNIALRALVRHVLEDHAGALRNDALPSIARTRVADDPTARTRRQVYAIKVGCVEHRAEIVSLVPPFPGVNLDLGITPTREIRHKSVEHPHESAAVFPFYDLSYLWVGWRSGEAYSAVSQEDFSEQPKKSKTKTGVAFGGLRGSLNEENLLYCSTCTSFKLCLS